MSSDKDFNVDELLKNLFPHSSLSDLFNQRVEELEITPTKALEIIGIEYRALQCIINGTSPRVDARNFSKIGGFLNISKEEVIELFYKALEDNFPDAKDYPEDKVIFLKKHIDLAALKKVGFIDDISDYMNIEKKINSYFGFNSIFEYQPIQYEVAFSAGIRAPKKNINQEFWINAAINFFQTLDNPYDYNKQELINYFPKIRWQSMDVEYGLVNVINDLYRLGISVYYLESLPSLHLKGATLIINGKPWIILTDYMGFYTTLWHTLCHELYHVLFDFEEIEKFKYHISEEINNELPLKKNEMAADNFAREYLFSKEKLGQVKAHINNAKFVSQFALKNQVHESFIYTYYAFEFNKIDPKAWIRVKSKDPSLKGVKEKLENPWNESRSVIEHIEKLKKEKNYI